ncbi:hypothetical protein EIN_095750 [Entamoeba invadens IP1]|uniref:Uncharacterized protein n=1 Tax=Entamoeba invadens IP1 TaxID=370355 RepID=A0A0A1U3J9_ENTIV|nr:hypothetical protein EIN_095750 [Entamoeba invadens IP1]ELP87318.1 hypothetical protein EIN_095750 [Entamoeba invadens IP1]|eukprot:XP_004254089.1 hypothetical protein EIN_095750 [Entamoeba invadens IP1]
MEEPRLFQSRCKKALSAAMLVHCFMNIGGRVTFSRAKQSNYALKVLIGKQVVINDVTYTQEDMCAAACTFANKMKALIREARSNKRKEIRVDKQCLKAINTELPNEIPKTPKSTITLCRNREAAFSNFIAYILVQHGFAFNITLTTIKESTSVMHFYVWDAITDNNGITLSTLDNTEPLINFIRNVTSLISHKKSILSINDISKTPSAFSPADISLYQVTWTEEHKK